MMCSSCASDSSDWNVWCTIKVMLVRFRSRTTWSSCSASFGFCFRCCDGESASTWRTLHYVRTSSFCFKSFSSLNLLILMSLLAVASVVLTVEKFCLSSL